MKSSTKMIDQNIEPFTEKRLIKIVIPDAGPINTLAAAGMLALFLAPENTRIVLIQTVFNEIIFLAPELKEFLEANIDRIEIIKTSICLDDEAKVKRGEPIGKGRGDLAIADFLMNYIDDSLGNSPALVIYEDRKLIRLHDVGDISENTHFITTASYLKKLEAEGIIRSFDSVWKEITDANFSLDEQRHRSPSDKEVEKEADKGSTIFPQQLPLSEVEDKIKQRARSRGRGQSM